MCVRKNFVLTSLLIIPLFSASPILSQSQTFSSLPRGMDGLQKCREAAMSPFAVELGNPGKQGGISPFFSAERPEAIPDAIKFCERLLAEERPPEIAWRDDEVDPLRHPGDLPTNKPAPTLRVDREAGLKDIGEEGISIARAREAVSEILEGRNACSAWFGQLDPQVAATFQSLTVSVDDDGPKHVIKERDGRGNWIEHGPYVAKTHQGSGPGTTITVNANGAFFRTRGDVYKLQWTGSIENDTGTWRHLHIGPFDGGSLQGQVIALLHELAHVIGAVPSDGSSLVGFARSHENTELILRHCQAAADAAGKRPKLLSAQKH
jgi:hypothetical protein